jgi:hypothetical protein
VQLANMNTAALGGGMVARMGFLSSCRENQQ